jgi:hypothetical protein
MVQHVQTHNLQHNLLTEETDSFENRLDPCKVFMSKNTLIPKHKGSVQFADGQK